MAEEAIKLEDILLRQQALVERMQAAVAGAPQGERMLELAAQMQREAQALEALARGYEAQAQGEAKTPRGVVQVQLTEAQRRRVRDEVGIEMELLQIQDAAGLMNQAMPVMTPAVIEEMALAEARRRKQTRAAEAEVAAQVGAVVAELERHPHVKEKLDELRRDPNYMGGMLKKG